MTMAAGPAARQYIIALDQGTTSSRAVVFDTGGTLVGIKNRPFKQIFPMPGWVEHDPEDILQSQIGAMEDVLRAENIRPEDIRCIGIANQRETVILWDKDSGKPVYNAIVWQCRRTAPICQKLIEDGYQDMIREKTGLVADAYFSASKIKWILDNVGGARAKAEKGKLLAGTVDTWLLWNLTGGKVHATDYTNASRTMLFNIRKLAWDSELLDLMGIPEALLPKVMPSSGFFGETDKDYLGFRIPVTGMAGDQQSSLFGQACFTPGSVKNTYGTGCFILMNTGSTPFNSKNKLLATIAWNIGGKTEYALEGSIFNTGSAIQWLRDELGIIDSAPQANEMAESVPDTGGVYAVPAFTGLGAPYWDMYARGTIAGITRGTRREHIVRAVLESIAYHSRDVIEAMAADSRLALSEIRADGGASNSNFLMQFQADILGVSVRRPKVTEITALGAAYLAGIGAGIWSGMDEVAAKARANVERIFSPVMDMGQREQKYAIWKKAVLRSMDWEK